MLYQENQSIIKNDFKKILNIYLHRIMAPPPLNKVKDFRAIF